MAEEAKDDCKALSDLVVELEQNLTALKEVRTGKAGAQGELDAKKLLFETENKKAIDELALLKTSEIDLTNHIRYIALKLHALNGVKRLAGGKVTIKTFKEIDMKYDVKDVMEWAEEEAPTLIKKVLDVSTFRAMLEERGEISLMCGVATATVRQEPRAQISKTL